MRNPKSYSILFKNIFLVLCCIVCHAGFSQNRSAKDYAVSNIHSLSSGQNEPVNIKPLTGPALVVPVVFHIVSSHPASITDQQIQSFIQDLNNAFAHAGNYGSGNGSNTRITFSLARTGPEGGISSGITRTQSALGDFDGDIENNRLKKLISWDTKAYCNVWLVDGIKNEYFTSFSCGNWSRKYNTGYTSFSPNGDYRDGIVTSQSGPVLAMLMGKYLGLNFTFVLGSCSNKNCNTDGDGICDTPPASGPGNSCVGYKNSCTTDTVSGFSKDVPDLDSNFMSFSGNCSNSFTEGQAEKMRSTLTGERNSLLTQGKYNLPCSENLTAVFDRNNWFPVPGDVIQFKSVSTGATGFQWTLNDQAAGSNSPDFTYRFNDAGRYKVTLKAFNTNQACNVAYSDSVIVGCGVMARFYPDKRLIASKDQILNDTISFTNRSVNGGNYQWWISNNSGILPQIVSTDPNLIKFFPSPGQYAVWLVAFNGDCSDTSEKFIFNVLDPTMDATISFENVECYEETKIKVDLRVCNQGYAPLPAETPITFYDGDPRTDTANKLDQTYLLTSDISGNCCKGYSTIVNIGRLGLNRLYAAINDKGDAVPVHFPNTSVPEKAFTNNIAFDSNFKFRVTAVPSSAVLEPGDTLQISANAGPGIVLSYLWSSNVGLNCSDCANPFFIAGRENATKKVIAASSYGCTDSTFVTIKIPFADDYVITVDSMTCANDSSVLGVFTIRNKFARGAVPDGLKVSFYEGDPATDTARLLQPVYSVKSNNSEKYVSFRNLIHGFKARSFYAVVNDNGLPTPISLPADSLFPEKNYINNSNSFSYLPFSVAVYPSDTTVSRLMKVPLSIETSGGQAISYYWDPQEFLSCSNCSGPVVTPAHSQRYDLEVQNEYACKAKAFVSINTFTDSKVNIPNAFTPNGDGRNDIFYIMGSQDIKLVKAFSVFNRWGQAVFSQNNIPPNDPRFGWNGLNHGMAAASETYVYVAIIEFADGSQQVYKGSVVLIL